MRRPLIVVVDDTDDNREMYIEYLRFAGFEVVGATDGEGAIAIARQLQPALMLMDLSLPGIDGWEATRILKEDPTTSDILIVALSGHAEAAGRARALEVGCDSFIPKPCLPKELATHLLRLLDGRVKHSSGADMAGVGRARGGTPS